MKLKLTLAGVRHITGYRGPPSHTPTDSTFQVIKEYGFDYDSSIELMMKEPQWWPFTMDYGLRNFDCLKPPCPQCERLCFILTFDENLTTLEACLLYTSPSPRDGLLSRMPSSA